MGKLFFTDHAIERLGQRFSVRIEDVIHLFRDDREYVDSIATDGDIVRTVIYKNVKISGIMRDDVMITILPVFNKQVAPIQATQTMTIGHLASVLQVSTDLIKKRIREIYPEKMKNGIRTSLSEAECTAIKLRIQQNSSLATYDDRNRLADMPQTPLEKKMIVAQAMQFLNEEIEELKHANEIMKPKAAIVDHSFRNSTQYSIRDAGKDLGIRQSEIFAILRDKCLLTTKNLPTQKALDNNLLSIKINVTDNGNYNQSVMTTANIMNFKSKYLKESE